MDSRSASLTWLTNLTKQKPDVVLAQIRKEFVAIAGGASDNTIGPHRVGMDQLEFSRYQNVPLLEATRVPLRQTAAGTTECYHANFVNLARAPTVVIAAMAPQRRSESVFWSLIWDQNVARIVCLTDLYERRREKTSKYWPDPVKPKTIKHFSIKNVGVTQEQGYIVSTLEVQNTKANEMRTVEHWFYCDWPDQSGPHCTHVILNMADKLNSVAKNTLVHCSAGIGRTGCMLAIMSLKMKIEKGEQINLPEIVHSIRLCRARCIQNDIQYIFLYWCAVLEHLKKCELPNEEKLVLRKKLLFLKENSTKSNCSADRRAGKEVAAAFGTKKTTTEGTSTKPSNSAFARLAEFLSFKKKKATASSASSKEKEKRKKKSKNKPQPGADKKAGAPRQ